jgi:hypothetical protein
MAYKLEIPVAGESPALARKRPGLDSAIKFLEISAEPLSSFARLRIDRPARYA